MSPDVLYTTIVFSLSIGFFATSLITTFFMEDKKGKFYVPGFVLLSIFITLVVETIGFGVPPFAFAPIQLIAIPFGSLVAFGIFFYAVHLYTEAKAPA